MPRTFRLVAPTLSAALLLAASLGSVAGEARAIADPRFSLVSPVLVGTSSGLPTHEAASSELPASSGFEVVVRDVVNAPVLGRVVTINLAATGVRLYAAQETGCTVNCAAHTLSEVCLTGTSVFHARFGGSCNNALAAVDAAGVILAFVPVRSTDMDGLGGSTGLADFMRFAPLYLARATDHPEADFDASGGPIDLDDLTIMAREYLLGAQGTDCP